MCGIAGKLNFDLEPLDPSLIQRMNKLLTHRGPDDEGIWSDGPIGLGQRRLAIVDLSPAGHQPMSNEDGTIWITFNGEIYNHSYHRPRLERQGHRYRGNSDTETILHLYEEYGRDCVQHLRGMFALAIWDQKKRLLLLARDRLGQKPLLYARTAKGLTFASEIKAILQDEAVPLAVNETALHHYLTYGYVPSPMTAFEQIYKLPPAHTLVWQDGKTTIERYWSLSYGPKLALDETEAAQQTLAQLQEAVQLRLMSDVPLGAFLSGGIDSSAVVALMAQAMSEPVKTFSIGFEEQSFNETAYARQVAQQYQTDHHEFIVKADAMALLPELVWAYGEPFADSSALPSYYIAKMTGQHVTVALNGDGGDEAFAGYDRYRATRLADHYEKIPCWLRQSMIQPLAKRLPESTRRDDPVRRLKRLLLAMEQAPQRRYAQWITLITNEHKDQLYSDDFRRRMLDQDSIAFLEALYQQADSPDFVEQTLFVDCHSYLPDDLLVKVDIATMCHSLEGRSPFLDHELVEFAAQLDMKYKLRGSTHKYILKKALEPYLPSEILHRPKQGFGVPVGHWFRHELKDLAYQVLLDSKIDERAIFNRVPVQRLLDEHTSGKYNHWQRIWSLLMLELWFRSYVDRPRSALSCAAESIF